MTTDSEQHTPYDYLTPEKYSETPKDKDFHLHSIIGSDLFHTPVIHDIKERQQQPTSSSKRQSSSTYKARYDEDIQYEEDVPFQTPEEMHPRDEKGRSESNKIVTNSTDTDNNLTVLDKLEIIHVHPLLWKGVIFDKIPFHTFGGAKPRFVRIQPSDRKGTNLQVRVQLANSTNIFINSDHSLFAQLPICLELLDPKRKGKPSKSIYLRDVCEIKMGSQTTAFQAFLARHGNATALNPSQCISILCEHRSVDFYAETEHEAITWVQALQQLLLQLKHSQDTTAFNFAQLPEKISDHEQMIEDAVFAAVRFGDVEQFQWFMDQGFSANHLERSGFRDSPLIAACRFGKSDIVQIALQYNAKNDPHPTFGQTALQVAVSAGHEDCVRLLVDTASLSGSDLVIVNHEDSLKEAPVHVASRCGSLNILKILLQHGANIYVVNARGNTCLHVAVQGGHSSCVRCILDSSRNTLLDERNADGLTSIHIAAQMNRIECLIMLIESGADIHARTFDGLTPHDIARRRKFRKVLYELEKSSRFNKEKMWHQDDLVYERYFHQTHVDPLFDGLSLHKFDVNSRNIQDDVHFKAKSYHDSLTYGPSPITASFHNYSSETQSYDQLSSYPVETFYLHGVLWFVYLDRSGYLYYHRVKDTHSQWEDPRHGHYEKGPLRNDSVLSDQYPSQIHNKNITTETFHQIGTETFIMNDTSEQLERKALSLVDGFEDAFAEVSFPTAMNASNETSSNKDMTLLWQEKHMPNTQYYSSFQKMTQMPKNQSITMGENVPNCGTRLILNNFVDDPTQLGQKIDEQRLFDVKTVQSGLNTANISKMIDMGVPMDAAVHKMTADQVDRDTINAFKSNVRTNAVAAAPDHPDPLSTEQYRKMINMGVPMDAAVHKMTADQVDRDTINAFKSNVRTNAAAAPDQPDLLSTEKYRKMINMGVPMDAVVHKMTADQVDRDTIIAFKSNVRTNAAAAPDQPDLLSTEKYRKMIDMGVPMDAAVHKMTADQVDRDTINAFKSNVRTNAAAAPDQPDLLSTEKYRKMINMGVPMDALVHKMTADQVDRDTINAFKSNVRTNAAAAAAPDQPDLLSTEKYRKMIDMGVPMDAVVHKMTADGIRQDIIKMFNLQMNENSAPDKFESPRRCSNPSGDPIFAKYIKMIQVGIPSVAVELKMKQDNIPSEKIKLFKMAHLYESKDVSKASTLLSPPRRPSTAPTNRAAHFQKIYWNTVSESKLNDSLWATDDVTGDAHVDFNEIKELESLFAAKPVANIKSITKKVDRAEAAQINNSRLIELKRANNVAIALAQYRSFRSYDELCEAVTSQDRGKLSVEKLLNMKNLLPTTAELETMKRFCGGVESLGRAELFFLAVSRVPRFAQKLDTFIFITQFTDQIREFEQTSSFLEQICTEIMTSKKLTSILRKLLAVGNAVNEKSGTPKAVGITVDSLLKTAIKKGIDGKTTILDHVVNTIMKQDMAVIVKMEDSISSASFRDDMPSIRSASKIDASNLKSTLRELKTGVERLTCLVKEEESEVSSQVEVSQASPLFIKQCNNFITSAELQLRGCQCAMEKLDDKITSLCRFFAEDPNWDHLGTIFSTLLDFSKLVDQSVEKWIRQEKADRRKALLNTPIKTTRESVKPSTPAKVPR